VTRILCNIVTEFFFKYYLQYYETLKVRHLHNNEIYCRLFHLHTLTNLLLHSIKLKIYIYIYIYIVNQYNILQNSFDCRKRGDTCLR